MAYLINAKNYSKNNGYSEYKKGNYANKYAVRNTIKYVTRDSDLLKRSKNEAYSWGGKGCTSQQKVDSPFSDLEHLFCFSGQFIILLYTIHLLFVYNPFYFFRHICFLL